MSDEPCSTCIRRSVVVRGRVQGVWFRESVRQRAEKLGVSGWVRNRLDGSVEAELEGDTDAVQALIAWCHDGPPHARVDTVEFATIAAQNERGFRVR